jgi:hypothetical protein
MAEAVVADFEGGFGDVALAGAQKFGGAFHAELAKVLLNGHAAFLAEKAAQVKWAAPNLFAERFESGGLGKIFAQDLAGAFYAVACGALGASAKEFAAGGPKEKVRREFKRFAAEPYLARGLEDGALLEGLDELEMQVLRRSGAEIADCSEPLRTSRTSG